MRIVIIPIDKDESRGINEGIKYFAWEDIINGIPSHLQPIEISYSNSEIHIAFGTKEEGEAKARNLKARRADELPGK